MVDNSVLAILAAFLTAAIGSLASYRLAVRRASGKVTLTDADSLWKEAGSIRRELQEEIVSLRRVSVEQQTRLDMRQTELSVVKSHLDDMGRLSTQLRLEMAEKNTYIQKCIDENAQLAQRVSDLETKLIRQLDVATVSLGEIQSIAEATNGGTLP